LSGNAGARAKFEVGADGVAAIRLEPTNQSGEVVLRFNFGDNRTQEVRAWLSAELREWVLVGFAEGTLGHKRLAGNMEALQAAGADDQLFDQDRLAFYAKGRVRGDFLLTLAYDSAKERGTDGAPVLRQAVDPAKFYTLYGDATQPGFDAASTSKLYLKIEKQQFYALFGDFDTGLTVSQLARYSRTLTGVKSEYRGEHASYNAFAARTSQGFLRDDLQGDGTSGLYRLRGRNIVLNSDKVSIEVRDRFHPEKVLSSRSLARFLDYELDPVAGTLFFREPIPSRDAALNPVFIVAEYETDDHGAEATTYGARGALKLGERSELGLTRIHEGTPGREGTLTGVDATVQVSETTRIHAEAARSNGNTEEGPQSGSAFLAEVTHDDGKAAARAYVQKQDPGFGLGQQSAASKGLRTAGVEGRYRVTDQVHLQGQLSRQEELATPVRRDVAEARVDWAAPGGLALNGGVRAISETDANGEQIDARQAIAGASYDMADRGITLRAAAEIDVRGGGTASYPDRLVLGIDYRLTPETTLFAEQEFARGTELRANTTRVGMRSQLWTGAEARVGLGQQGLADANRLYSTMGLVQRVKIDEHWAADAAIDRVQTLRAPANALGPDRPLPSGTPSSAGFGILTGDYTAVSLGLAYTEAQWSGNARAEWRGSDTDTKVNLLLGAQRRLGQGRSVAAALAYLDQRGADAMRNVTGQLSYAFRPVGGDWMWMERLRYVEESSGSLASRLFTRKLISNFNANWKAGPRSQVALQYSAKYVREMLGDVGSSGFTDLAGIEARHDLGERWDLGASASVLSVHRLHARSYQLGVSVGYRLTDNTWVAVGYNHLGFSDRDFAGAEYRAKGLYVALRVKFDQDTFDLNDRAKGPLSLKP
ncbi:MAG TPA: hypothetical protein VFM98_20380, partial [Ramlibacter sp.]|uniref:hypothetical protein n=1 Tax=Ramlibacter sp. TaxID=1917967 RepID=UPI002D8057CB